MIADQDSSRARRLFLPPITFPAATILRNYGRTLILQSAGGVGWRSAARKAQPLKLGLNRISLINTM
jgi:hypothetical protein